MIILHTLCIYLPLFRFLSIIFGFKTLSGFLREGWIVENYELLFSLTRKCLIIKTDYQALIYFNYVVLLRFELRQADPETAVLPLHHKTMKFVFRVSKLQFFFILTNWFWKKRLKFIPELQPLRFCCLTRTRTLSGRTKNCSATITPWDNRWASFLKRCKDTIFFFWSKGFWKIIRNTTRISLFCC